MKKLLVFSVAVMLLMGIGLTSASAQPVSINDGGIGDALLFSLYDVRDNVEDDALRTPAWQNYIAIENTTGAWTAFHLRFRAWKKSIEVWDHVILLSPYDVFWMTIKKDNSKHVRLYSEDKETLKNSGLIWGDQSVWTDYFKPDLLLASGFCAGDSECLDNEMRAGYVEVIGLWQLEIPQEVCGYDENAIERCSEDTHDITNIVADVNKFVGPDGIGGRNVYDVQDALFYRFFPWVDWVNSDDSCNYPGCVDLWEGKPVIDASWPDYDTGDPTRDPGVAIFGMEEGSDSYVRFGLDCGNVLAGVLFMTDQDTGRFQMENYIALTDFRTNQPEFGGWPHLYYIYRSNVGGAPGPNLNYSRNLFGGSQDLGPGDWVTQNNPGAQWWTHRDGYPGGGIFFPASAMFWYYGYAYDDFTRIFAGGDEQTFLWYYVLPTPTTTVGPTFVDGDDLIGYNWNDANFIWPIPVTNKPLDQYGYYQPLGDLGPVNWSTLYTAKGWFVHYFNDIFSLDDVEAALNKGSIWYTHWNIDKDLTGGKVNVTTDVVLTFPTKHNHWFFADWPIMWQWANAAFFPITGGSNGTWNKYLNNVWEYLGDLNNPQTNQNGLKSVEELVQTVYDQESNPADFNHTKMTLADWFDYKYFNGHIYAGSYLWDFEQELCGPGTPEGPPPSPVPPNLNTLPIPHEVNIIRVGHDKDHTGTGLGDANFLLACGKGSYAQGHWEISSTWMENGQRQYGMYTMAPWCTPYIAPQPKWDGYYPVPAIGVVIVQNDAGEDLAARATRSAMAEWHYTSWPGWCWDRN